MGSEARRGAAALLAAALLAGCGTKPAAVPSAGGHARPPVLSLPPALTSSTPDPAARRPRRTPPRPALAHDLAVSYVGEGTQAAWIIRRRRRAHDPVVLFLHGWGATSPAHYDGWLAHLAREGNTVLYPVYQGFPFLQPGTAFRNVVAGVRAALGSARPRLSRAGWVVAGHSAGGAMSADYAVRAAGLGLPRALGVLQAYPGRMIRRIPFRLPEADPADLPASTRLVCMYSPTDATVGATTALRTCRRATAIPPAHRTLVRVTDPTISDHLGPGTNLPAARRVFWRRLDRLIHAARR